MPLAVKEKLNNLFGNVWFLWSTCLLVNIITFLVILLKINPGNKNLALHYNVVAGVEWYGRGINLYFLPAVALAITAVNFTLYQKLKDNQKFFSFLLFFVSACAQLIVLAAVLFLARVN